MDVDGVATTEDDGSVIIGLGLLGVAVDDGSLLFFFGDADDDVVDDAMLLLLLFLTPIWDISKNRVGGIVIAITNQSI